MWGDRERRVSGAVGRPSLGCVKVCRKTSVRRFLSPVLRRRSWSHDSWLPQHEARRTHTAPGELVLSPQHRRVRAQPSERCSLCNLLRERFLRRPRRSLEPRKRAQRQPPQKRPRRRPALYPGRAAVEEERVTATRTTADAFSWASRSS